MRRFTVEDGWESDDGTFMLIEDHEAILECYHALFRMVGAGILAERAARGEA